MSIQTERETSRKERKRKKLREEEETEDEDELEENEYDEDDPENEENLEDEEDFEDEEAERKHKKKKKNGFPVGALIFMFALIGIAVGAGYFGMQYYEQNRVLHERYDAAVAQASEELNAANEELFLADPDSPANSDIREELKSVLLADAQEKAEKLANEEAEIDAALHEAESRIGELEKVEDFDYYKAIYDEYVEGREYVEELLSGN